MTDPADIPRQRFLDQCTDPVFLLDRKVRILHVNQAWQDLTGLTLSQVRGQVCQRRLTVPAGSLEALWNALAPPVETLNGSPRNVRRFLSFPKAQDWDIAFFPFRNGTELLGIVGTIQVVVIDRPKAMAPLPNNLLALRERVRQQARLDRFIATAPKMQRVLGQIRLAAQTDTPVWLVGEPGTGKRWTGRVIHQESGRAKAPFMCVDCARWPVEVLQEQLFGSAGVLKSGHVGTVFLHELPALPREQQAALGDWLMEIGVTGPNGPRLLAGSNQTPDEAVRSGQLLEPLANTFGVLTISLPPLRDRKEDIPLLADHLFERIAPTPSKKPSLEPDVQELLGAASWPGNVRELQRVIGQIGTSSELTTVTVEHLPWYLRTTPAPDPPPLDLDGILQQVERRLITLAMQRCNHNKTKAAEMLSIWRARLVKRCKEMGLDSAQAESD